uniref:Somatostatin receptor type 2-like isoform X4 n=1 Tax=Diabrotica virgifera virgifera TaxID=50390 RepID=A0A6P7GKK1_DIAVI
MAESFDIAKVEEDPLAEVNLTVFYEQIKEAYDILHYTSYFTDTIKFLLCIISIVADICIITIITKNPKLKTVTNRYILHYSIWHIVFMVFFPMFFVLFNQLHLVDILKSVIPFIIFKINSISLSLLFLVGLCLALDWFLNIYSPHFSKSSALFNKYGIYLLYSIDALIFIIGCIVEVFILNGLYYFVALCLLVFNFLHYRSNKNENNLKNYGLIPANIIVFFWLPLFIHDELLMWSIGSCTLYITVLYTMFLADWFSLTMSLVLIIALIRMDINIKVAMLKLFNRRNIRYNNDVETLEKAENDGVETM